MTKKPTLEICLTPDAVSLINLDSKTAVVVDIFRATSCIVAGLAKGVLEVVPVAEIEKALAYKKQGFITAGERNGKKVEGFDIGNSPFEHMAEAGKRIAMTTTNGTQAIEAVKGKAKNVLIGAFLNLSVLSEFLKNQNENVVIVCAGWKGRFNAEDALFAGALALSLIGEDTENPAFFEMLGDETLFALHSYASAKNDLIGILKHSSHYQRLQKHGVDKDMAFCLEIDKFQNIPILEGNILRNNLEGRF